MTTVIHIDIDALDKRLDHGKLWTTGWGTIDDPTQPTCLHGAIRYCQPIPGDAYIIEQVSARYGFSTGDNDAAESWGEIKAKVVPDITDDMLAETFGPQWEPIVALVRRAAILTADEAARLESARDAAWAAAWAAAGDAAWDAARAAAWVAAQFAVGDAARGAVGDAARVLAIRDLIGQHGFTQEHYDTLTRPWATAIGKVHPDDAGPWSELKGAVDGR